MKDRHKTKAQLLQEVADLRQRVAELNAREDDRKLEQRLNNWAAAELRMKDSAVETSINAIAFADLDGNLVYVNESFLRMWKHENEEDVLGESFSRFWQNRVEASEVVEALRNKGKWAGELIAMRKDGSLFTVQVSANMVTDDKGTPLCMMGAFVDITERKRMEEELEKHRDHLEELVKERTQELEQEIAERKKTEEALRGSEASLKQAQHLAHLGSWEWNLEDDSFWMSEEMCRLCGIPESGQPDTIQSVIDKMIHPDDREFVKKMASRVSTERTGRSFEYRVIRPDGEIRLMVATQPEVARVNEDGEPKVMIGAVQDITVRKKAEEALLKSLETRSALMNATTESAILIDIEGTIHALNEIAADRLGQKVEDLVGVNVDDILPPNVAASRKVRANEVIRTGRSVRYTDQRAGMIFDQTVFPVFNAQGNVELLAIFAQDITERKCAEKELQESEELFRTIVEVAPSLLVITDEHGRNKYVSPNCEEMTGYTQEELFGTVIWWVHEEDTQRAKDVFDRTIHEGKGGENFEYKAVKKNGDVWYASSSWKPLRDSQGKFKGVVVQTIDITERKRMEEALKRSKFEWEITFDSISDWVALVDLEARIVRTNLAGEEFAGMPVSDMIGQKCCTLVHGSEEPLPWCPFRRMLDSKQRETVEFEVDDKNRWLMVTVDPVMDTRGNLLSAVHTVRDISERKCNTRSDNKPS